jgi:hypothetical protein
MGRYRSVAQAPFCFLIFCFQNHPGLAGAEGVGVTLPTPWC